MEMQQPSPVGPEVPSTPRPCAHRLRARIARLRRRDVPRLAGRVPWGVLLVAALAAAAIAAVGQVPLRERARIEARLGSFLTGAPVLLVGDSIAYQAGPERLCGARVFNAAVPGDRVANLVADAPDYAARLSAGRVVIAIGANDAWPSHRPLDAWIADYRRLAALYAGRELVLVEINPPDMTIPLFVQRLDQDFIAGANAAIRAIAAETGARLVPAPRRTKTRDGLHPTPPGADLWRARLVEAACG